MFSDRFGAATVETGLLDIPGVRFYTPRCVRRAQEARLQSLAMQLAESDCTLRVTNTP